MVAAVDRARVQAGGRHPAPEVVVGDVVQRLGVLGVHRVELLDHLQRRYHAVLRRQVGRRAEKRRLHGEGFLAGRVQLQRAVDCLERLLVVAQLVEAVGDAHADGRRTIRVGYGGAEREERQTMAM